jgi:hypothetical protein
MAYESVEGENEGWSEIVEEIDANVETLHRRCTEERRAVDEGQTEDKRQHDEHVGKSHVMSVDPFTHRTSGRSSTR